MKSGISLSLHYPLPYGEVLRLIKEAGFCAVSPQWSVRLDMPAIAAAAREQGLILQSLHAPFARTADLWSADPQVCGPAKDLILQALEDCARLDIPILVMHAWIGFEAPFDETALHFGNFEQLVAYAAAHHIKIAFENTEGEEYLAALMDYFKDTDTVGFCWDSGHEMCYNRSQDLLARYGHRLLMTHLNDNLGASDPGGKITNLDDLHLLPYDGIADWAAIARRLAVAKKQDILNLELLRASKPGRHDNDAYGQMPLRQFFALAHERSLRIGEMYKA